MSHVSIPGAVITVTLGAVIWGVSPAQAQCNKASATQRTMVNPCMQGLSTPRMPMLTGQLPLNRGLQGGGMRGGVPMGGLQAQGNPGLFALQAAQQQQFALIAAQQQALIAQQQMQQLAAAKAARKEKRLQAVEKAKEQRAEELRRRQELQLLFDEQQRIRELQAR